MLWFRDPSTEVLWRPGQGQTAQGRGKDWSPGPWQGISDLAGWLPKVATHLTGNLPSAMVEGGHIPSKSHVSRALLFLFLWS